jgi:hypothetical protein
MKNLEDTPFYPYLETLTAFCHFVEMSPSNVTVDIDDSDESVKALDFDLDNLHIRAELVDGKVVWSGRFPDLRHECCGNNACESSGCDCGKITLTAQADLREFLTFAVLAQTEHLLEVFWEQQETQNAKSENVEQPE